MHITKCYNELCSKVYGGKTCLCLELSTEEVSYEKCLTLDRNLKEWVGIQQQRKEMTLQAK